MNDTELDQLLDSWEAPPPPSTLRSGLRARFPRSERRRLSPRLGWALAFAAASCTVVFGLAQVNTKPVESHFTELFNHVYEHVTGVMASWEASDLVTRIRESRPKVYFDGQLGPALRFDRAKVVDVDVPGEGRYSFTSVNPKREGWTEAGHIHDKTIQFRAGRKLVRIECASTIFDSDRPVFVKHRTGVE